MRYAVGMMKENPEQTSNPVAAEPQFILRLPKWLAAWEAALPPTLPDDEAAMRVAIEVARRNVEMETGGPFGAVIVAEDTRERLAIGANWVIAEGSSLFHAEISAILRAEVHLRSHRLSGRRFTLYSSAEPCAMCMGAIPWSGLSRVVCAATDADVRAIGFDEGDKPANWTAAYERRGIAVRTGFMRAEGRAVLEAYRQRGGTLY